jgi:type IV secretion system protein VirB7
MVGGKMIKAIAPLIIPMFLAGCSTTGPFVTGVSSNGDGSLLVEKCMVTYNAWSNNLGMKDCTSHTIKTSSASIGN